MQVIGFDTGPGNYLIDEVGPELKLNKEFDKDGLIAQSGQTK